MPVTATAKTPTGRRRATRKTRRRLEREAKKAKRAACQRGGGRNKGRAAPSSQPTGRGNTEAPLEAHQGAAGAHRSKSTATKASIMKFIMKIDRICAPDIHRRQTMQSRNLKAYIGCA